MNIMFRQCSLAVNDFGCDTHSVRLLLSEGVLLAIGPTLTSVVVAVSTHGGVPIISCRNNNYKLTQFFHFTFYFVQIYIGENQLRKCTLNARMTASARHNLPLSG